MSDLEQAIRISPRDSYIGIWYMQMGLEPPGVRGRYAEAIEKGSQGRRDSGYRTVLSYTALAAFYAAADRCAGGEGRAGRGDEIESQTLLSLVSGGTTLPGSNDGQPSFREALIQAAGLPEE